MQSPERWSAPRIAAAVAVLTACLVAGSAHGQTRSDAPSEITVVLTDQFGRGIGSDALAKDGDCVAAQASSPGTVRDPETDRSCYWRVRDQRGDPLVVDHLGPTPAAAGQGSRYVLTLDTAERQTVTVQPSLRSDGWCPSTSVSVDTASPDPVILVVYRHVENVRFAVPFVEKRRVGGVPKPLGDLITRVSGGPLGEVRTSQQHPPREYGGTILFTLDEGWNECGTWSSREYELEFGRVDVDPGRVTARLDTHGLPGPEDDPPSTATTDGEPDAPEALKAWLRSPARARPVEIPVRRFDLSVGATAMLTSHPGLGFHLGGVVHGHLFAIRWNRNASLGIAASVALMRGGGETEVPSLPGLPSSTSYRDNLTWSGDVRLCLTLLARRGFFLRPHVGLGWWGNREQGLRTTPSNGGPLFVAEFEAELNAFRWLYIPVRAGYRLLNLSYGAFHQEFNLFGARAFPDEGAKGEKIHAVQVSVGLGFRM